MIRRKFLNIIFVLIPFLIGGATSYPAVIEGEKRDINIGSCVWVIDRKCPDEDVKFYIYTQKNPHDRQYIHIDETWETSNISESNFNPNDPVKIIIHGYNSDMFLHPLAQMKDEYLQKGDYNIIYVDWSNLSPGPCYLSAVHNARHTGTCIGQLIERILEGGTANIHLIGFSLGAQVTNFVAQSLGSFIVPRITGLDPAMPLFIMSSPENKLDPSDAAFVDIIHTNALVQGKIERCGHVDFYMNGGIIQPGCYGQGENVFACSHHRAPDYFVESIRSYKGFWGWACDSYIKYLLGFCPVVNPYAVAGENCRPDTEGMYIVNTNSESPYAQGQIVDIHKVNTIEENPNLQSIKVKKDPLLRHIDEWGKIDGAYNNNINMNNLYSPTPYSQDPNGGNWPYFNNYGTKEITNLNENKNNEEKILPNSNSNKRKYNNLIAKEVIVVKHNDNNKKMGENQNLTRREHFFREYKRNMTKGFIDNNIFQVPVIN